jgi:hypothetical protein
MSTVLKHKAISILICVVVLAGVGFFALKYFRIMGADASSSVKYFRETDHGFVMQYPIDWSIASGYGRYAAGLLDIELNNNKCWVGYTECRADCVDIRIFAGKNPDNDQGTDLGAQLYHQAQAAKTANNKDLAEQMDIGGKLVTKIKSTAPTQALNGACGGPLYIYETDSGTFVYIFSGFGSGIDYAASEDIVKQIISSINVSAK